MKKILTSIFIGCAAMVTTMSASAQDEYIYGTPDPADGYVAPGLPSTFYVYFNDVLKTEEICNTSGYITDKTILAKIKVETENGLAADLSGASSMGGVQILEKIPACNNKPGFRIILPDMFLFNAAHGTLTFTIEEGFVESAEYGIPNAALSYAYYIYDEQTIVPTWNVEENTEFEFGEGSVSITWEGSTIESINRKFNGYAVYALALDPEDDTPLEGAEQINMMTNTNPTTNGLNINLDGLLPNKYIIGVHSGAIIFEPIDGEVNLTNYTDYTLTITVKETDAEFPVGSITPVSGTNYNQIGELQTVVVTWEGETVTLPEVDDEVDRTNPLVYYNEELLENVNYYLTIDGVKTEGSSGNGVVIDLSDSGIGAGIVKVVIPSNFVRVAATNKDNVTAFNEQVSATYSILVAPEYASDPADNASFVLSDDYSTVRITWPGTYFKLNNQGTVTVTKDGEPLTGVETEAVWYEYLEQTGYAGDSLSINLTDESELGEGTYVVTVPAGYVGLYGIYGDNTVNNQEVTMTFRVYPAFLDDATATPTANNTEAYPTLTEVTLTWEDPVTAAEGATLEVSVRLGTENEAVTAPASVVEGSLAIDLSSIFTEELGFTGNVRIMVPVGLVVNSAGNTNNSQTITYYVNKVGYIGNASMTEIMGDAGITGVNISWGEYELDFNDLCTEEVTLTGPTGAQVPTIKSVDINDNVLVVTFNAAYDGEEALSLTVPEEYVYVGSENVFNLEQKFTIQLETDGVNRVGVDIENNNVYTINGVRVNGNKLQKGIYIINGKKVIVK